MPKPDKEAAKRIKQLISRHNLTQKAFAEKCKVSANTISKACRGEMSLETARFISKACNVTLDFLYGNSEFTDQKREHIGFLDKHIYSDIHDAQLSNTSYSIPTLKFSPALIKYLKDTRSITTNSALLTSSDFALEEIVSNFINAAQNESNSDSFCEYVLVPIENCTALLLNDIGIYPKTDDTII